MVPVVELRGAIPIATASGLDLWLAILVSIVGNMIPVPFIILFIRKIFEWMRGKSEKLDKIVLAMERKAEKKRKVVDRYKFLGLFLLVAIPLPGTGAWTGALVAAMLEMRLKDAVPAIFLGVVGAGVIVALVTGGVLAAFGI
ncbi:MAG: small multi-drug export protein [Clostridia bacterium]|nr:small multi-drug export protein [Clostridia bacterium]